MSLYIPLCAQAIVSWVSNTFNQENLCFFFLVFFRASPTAYEVPRLGVESELQLPAYTTATATQDLSCICDLHHSSWQHWIPDQLRKARDRTHILMDTSRVRFNCATTGTPYFIKCGSYHKYPLGNLFPYCIALTENILPADNF